MIGLTERRNGAAPQESAEQVEQFSDARELGGVDLNRGPLAAAEHIVALMP